MEQQQQAPALDRDFQGMGAIMSYMRGLCTLEELARHLTWLAQQPEQEPATEDDNE